MRTTMLKAFLVTLLVLVTGCGEVKYRFPRPEDFPLHATDHPFFNLHWRLDRKEGVVETVGLVEAARQGGIAEVLLELRGLDASGRVVSRGLGRAYPGVGSHGGRLFLGDSWPFVVRLRPTGREDRFELRVWSYSWELGRGRASRNGR